MIVEFLWAFATGLAGSLHCLGMCGPLVIAYSLHLRPGGYGGMSAEQKPWLTGFAHHAAFHTGRVAAYGLLGGLAAGLVYAGAPAVAMTLPKMRIVASIAGGILMIFLGLTILKVIPVRFPAGPLSEPKGSPLSRSIASALVSPRLSAKWLLGFATGFLPCMLSWAMVVKAASTANITAGFFVMILFGMGTVPALLFTGLFASLVSLRVRLAGERIAGISVIAMGLILLWKGASKLV
jgi:uncharacterized protein